MIARIIIPLLLVIVLTYGYFYLTHRWYRKEWWMQLFFLILLFALIRRFVVSAQWLDYFPNTTSEIMYVIGVMVVFVILPATVALCGFVGRLFKRQRRGEVVGWVLAFLSLVIFVYGVMVGSRKLEVRHVEFASSELPAAFDGYKIVQVSDLHLGTFTGSRTELLREAVDSINAQQADMVVFTGDLQNKEPSEIEPHVQLLSTIKAKDGVFSVLGNHDYAEYINQSDPFRVGGNLGLTQTLQEEMGWQLLNNSHRRIRRDSSYIYVAGMENDGEGRFPQYGDIQHALFGLLPADRDFVVLLEHDPSSWERKILPHSHVQLTLSGHTHGGQFSIFGWSPVSLVYPKINGMYYHGDRALFVSKGLGGVIPFRFGATGEIAVITLHKK